MSKSDLSIAQFRGDLEGNGGEDLLAQQIAEAGEEWAQTHWRKVDMAAYM
jgi:hypothetical protein